MAEEMSFSETGVIGTAAEVVASVTRIGLRIALFPLMAMKDLPFGMGSGVSERSASFPAAIGKAFNEFAREMAGLGEPPGADLDKPGVHTYRDNGKDAAIVFVHGFGQNSQNTWGRFIDILAEDKKLKDWDVYMVGYTTNLMMDVAGLWSAAPPIDRLAQYLHTVTSSPPLDRYKSLAFVAHSMGGLVTQRTLVDYPDLRSRVNHVIFYGTPSGGLKKAGLAAKWKRQIRDMAKDSSFVVDLRQRWTSLITDDPPFAFRVVAGDQDELVPTWSSLEPFPEKFHTVVIGDHLAIVGPTTRDFELYKKDQAMHLSVEVLAKHLRGDSDPGGPLNSARLAVERSDFRRVIEELGPKADELDDDALVMLALAYDSTGQEKKAVAVIESRGNKSTDLMGVLAGRYKRRWLVERTKKDAERAKQLYADALAAAEKAKDPDQVYYHAINVAFLALAYDKDKKAVEAHAKKALAACDQAEDGLWKSATQGEANLYLGDDEAAVAGYEAALEKNPAPRQKMSIFQQAVRIAELLDNEPVAERLRAAFRDSQV